MCPCYVYVKVDSRPEFFAATFNFSIWYLQIVYLRYVPGLAKNANYNFSQFFSFCFSPSVCGSYHKPEFLLQSLWMAWNLTCLCILTTSELIRYWSSSVDFPHFGTILTWWKRQNLQLPDIFWRRQGRRNDPNFGMLMYPDHLPNLNFGHGLLIFLIFASF